MEMGEYDTVGEARALLALHGREMEERQRLVLLALITELEAARAVVEAACRFDEATNPCDLRAGIYAANGSGDEVEPLVTEAYMAADLLLDTIKAYAAARGEKAGE
jgi:hypothetical protein